MKTYAVVYFSIVCIVFVLVSVNIVTAQWVKQSGMGGTGNAFVSNGNTLYACSYGGLTATTNNGDTWYPVNYVMADWHCNSVAKSGTNLIGNFQNLMYRSTDDGKNWIQTGTDIPVSLRFISINNKFIASTVGGIYTSSDFGTTWTISNTGMPADTVLAFCKFGESLFAGTKSHGAFISTNQGASWSATNNSDTHAFYNFSEDGTSLYAVGDGNQVKGGVFRSADNGKTWIDITAGVHQLVNATGIVAIQNNLFVSTLNFGVYASNNNGQTWKAVNEGIDTWEMFCHNIILHNNYLFLATESGYIERRPLAEVFSQSSTDVSEVTQTYSETKCFPNPANKNVSMIIPINSNLVIKVYNSIGKEVDVTIQSTDAGTLTLNTEHLPNGVYRVCMVDNNKMLNSKTVCVQH
ncbi:MAG: T9SS type A sorting domain-containing protein [Candidatus Kapaibacterium sp.]